MRKMMHACDVQWHRRGVHGDQRKDSIKCISIIAQCKSNNGQIRTATSGRSNQPIGTVRIGRLRNYTTHLDYQTARIPL